MNIGLLALAIAAACAVVTAIMAGRQPEQGDRIDVKAIHYTGPQGPTEIY